MKSHRKLGGMLLATTMLAPASGVLAQDDASSDPQETGLNLPGPNYVITDQIIVRGSNIPDPQRATSQVATFLGAEDLARQGDSNAAEALKRLSGLSVIGGKFAFVRGLGDRYSAARLNGSPLPSPEPLRRTVPLDLFPSNILNGAAVQKTYSPNYPGEFGGGIIDLETLRTPDENFLNAKIGVGANLVTTASTGIFVRGGDLDFLGYDDGLRSVPGPLQSVISSGQRLEDLDDAQLEIVGESLVNSPLSVIQQGNLGPNFEGSVDGGIIRDFDNGMSWGLSGVIGYKQDWTTETAIRQIADGQQIGFDGEQIETSLDATVNGLLTSALEWEDNAVTLTGLYIHSTTKEAQITVARTQAFTEEGLYSESNTFLERALIMGQATGEHSLGDQFAVNWRGAYARSTRDSPYERSFNGRVLDTSPNPTPLPFESDFTGNPIYGPLATTEYSINFSELTDDLWSGGLDLFWFIPVSGYREATLSAGYEYYDNDREFLANPFRFTTTTAVPADIAGARTDFLFSPPNIGGPNFNFDLVDAGDRFVSSYNGELLIHAAYAQIDAELIPTLRTTVGVRYEDSEQTVDTFDRTCSANPVPECDLFDNDPLNSDYWLPSATVTWNFTDDMQLRIGYSHTVARPQFRELAPSAFFDPATDRRYNGNPFLQNSEFRNYDARYEFYLGRNQFVTIGGFYKEIERPIEEIQFATGDFGFGSTFINTPKADLYGGEFEFRSNFDLSWNDWFADKSWLFTVNYTFTESEISATANDVIIQSQGGQPIEVPADQFGLDGSPLVGTPKHIVNSQFGWEGENTQFTVLVGWVSERLLARGEPQTADNALLDVFEKPGVQLDAVFRQDVNIRGTDFTIGLSARNLLGTRHIEFQEGTADPRAINGRVDFNTYDVGRSLSASLTAKF